MNASDVNQDLQLMSTSNDFTEVGIDNTIGTTDTNVDANQFDPDPNEQPIQASQLTPLQDQQFTNSDPSPASDFSNRESGTNVLTDTTNSQETASPTQDVKLKIQKLQSIYHRLKHKLREWHLTLKLQYRRNRR